MTRIDTAFERLKKEQKKGFIAYITGGDPSLAATKDMVLRMAVSLICTSISSGGGSMLTAGI